MKIDEILVMLADDHHIFREGVQSLFTGVKHIRIMDLAGSGTEAIEKYKENQPDVLLLDISLPDMNGFEVAERILKDDPNARIIILSMHENPDFIKKALKTGVKAYLTKEETTREVLVKAIEEVFKGKNFFTDKVAKVIENQNNIQNAEDSAFPKLSKRETEILQLIMEGLSNAEIAKKLFLSIRTVETHKFNIMSKLNMKSTVELVKYALKNKLVDFK
ncbi:MAG: response regulator transcription factor [Sphingobacteriales bacterium]|nr:response regulator transcription factor [Sphingobacteriales bacterium]